MSAVCMCCNDDIAPPNEFWAGLTYFSPTVNYVCGKCLSNIPKDQRIPISEMPLFQILFGKRTSKIGNSGNYQSNESKAEAPEFWVDPNVIARYLPNGIKFLYELYPYYCIAEFPYMVRDWLLNQQDPELKRTIKFLCQYGAPLEAMLLKRNPGELVRPRVFKGDYKNLTQNEVDLAMELFSIISSQYFF